MDGVLAKGEKVNFFHDEFRCPIYVKDLVTIVLALTSQWISGRIQYLCMMGFTFTYISRSKRVDGRS